MAYKKISELTTKGQTWSIKAKILRMWDSVNFATDEIMSFDMLLMDEEVWFCLYLIHKLNFFLTTTNRYILFLTG